MFWQIFIWLIFAASLGELVYLLYLAWASAHVPKLVLNDVVHFLYPVDLELLASLLDPACDFELRWRLSPRQYREQQRRRLRIYRELLLRMSHNSAVLAEFDNAVRGYSTLIAGPGSRLQESAVKVRIYCACSRIRLRLWLLLPAYMLGVLPELRLARLRTAASLDGLEAYGELKTAAAEAFTQLNPTEINALTHNL